MAKKYGLGGWAMPILHPHDPDYCEHGCPVCVGARRGSRLFRALQRVEMALLRGGYWWGKARQRKYGKPPDQPCH